jgi:flagellar biosynthetic protein FlhB
MAAEEKTELATPRKREDARKRGQVAKSADINAAIGLIACLIAIKIGGPHAATNLRELAESAFRGAAQLELTPSALQGLFASLFGTSISTLAPVLLAAAAGGLVANIAQAGFLVSSTPVIPDLSRLNPFTGFQRMLSLRAFAELAKGVGKLTVVSAVAYKYLHANYELVVMLPSMDHTQLISTLAQLGWGLMLRAAVVLLVIAVLDYMFQRVQFEKSIKMSRQEVKEEYRRTEGDPLTKSRVRQRQREMARARMIADVARATVVVSNPVHYAVAVRYEPAEMSAPTVLAKGQRLMAERIKEAARQHAVPIVENPPVAQMLFKTVEIGQEIPAALYQAMAEIIAYVYRLSGRVAG